MPAEPRLRPPCVPLLADREDALDRAAESDLDLVVVGGGITGAGVALDAAARGLAVALVERDDIASGTSSKSSKLVHGGLRYLEQREFRLVGEAVRERNLLRRLAPHLVRPLWFALPTPTAPLRAAAKFGLTVYDAMAAGRNPHNHERLDPTGLLASVPGLTSGVGLGGYRYADCQTDDARLALAVVQAARRLGALVVNHAEAVDFLRAGGRVVGVSVRDRIGGGIRELRARWTVSATGVWADRLRRLAGDGRPPLLTPSKGSHIVLDADDVRLRDAALIRSAADDGRLVFVIPWGRQVVVGTTDEHHDGSLDDAGATPPDVGYLLATVNAAFGTALTAGDAVGAWAGLRPLLRLEGRGATRDLSRRHAVFEDPPGLVTVTGGKLTTYRRMAEDVVDRIARAEGWRVEGVTDRLVLGPRVDLADAVAGLRALCATLGLPPEVAAPLVHRHGADAPAVAGFCAERGGGDPLVPGLPYLRGEIAWAVEVELARTLDDVLRRRTRVAVRDRSAGGAAVSWAADVLADELGWSPAERDRQLAAYLDGVRSERGPIPLDDSWTGGGQGDRTTRHPTSR